MQKHLALYNKVSTGTITVQRRGFVTQQIVHSPCYMVGMQTALRVCTEFDVLPVSYTTCVDLTQQKSN